MPKGLVACTLASSLGLEEISLANYVRGPAAAEDPELDGRFMLVRAVSSR
jgi:hypothetical protein